jgi:hypothetical protein
VNKSKAVHAKIKQAVTKVRQQKKLMIIEMPEEMETTTHWLLWLAVIALIGLVVSIGWQLLTTNESLQTYLPTL